MKLHIQRIPNKNSEHFLEHVKTEFDRLQVSITSKPDEEWVEQSFLVIHM